MKKYHYQTICKKCGQEYGQHGWAKDACPIGKNGPFHKTDTFEPKEAGADKAGKGA